MPLCYGLYIVDRFQVACACVVVKDFVNQEPSHVLATPMPLT